MAKKRCVIVGAGIFGASTALTLAERGYEVTLVDAGVAPHPKATSTDISKACRMEYGSDRVYMALMEDAFRGWESWNERWDKQGLGPLFHETGILFLTRDPMAPGSFEFESYQALLERGWNPQRLSPDTLEDSFPAWSEGGFRDGFFNPRAGFAESSKVVARLMDMAQAEGATLLTETPVESLMGSTEITGVRCKNGQLIESDEVVLCAGVWTSQLIPELAPCFTVSSHPVFHFKLPENSGALFSRSSFPVFAADVTKTGVYGFPVIDGVIKVATHGLGKQVTAESARELCESQHQGMRKFLEQSLPALKEAELVQSHLCFYCDTQDEEFWIARDPSRSGLTVASGGSGHGFKFAPLLGKWVHDVLEGIETTWTKKFSWRPKLRQALGNEEARAHNRE